MARRGAASSAVLFAVAVLAIAAHGTSGLSLRNPASVRDADDSLEFFDALYAPAEERREQELSAVDAAMTAKLAQEGDPEAQCLMGSLCEVGLGGAARNDTAAAEWYERSALSGYLGGAYNLATMYARGAGVARDFDEAARWFKIAAEELCDVHGHAARTYASGLRLDGVELRCERDPDDPRELTRLVRADTGAVAWDSSAEGALEELAALTERAEVLPSAATQRSLEDALVLSWGRAAPIDVDAILPHPDSVNTVQVSLPESAAVIGGRSGQMEADEALAGLLLSAMMRRGEHDIAAPEVQAAWRENEVWQEGVARLEKRAAAGSGPHAALLGALFRAGAGVEEDLAEAVRWFKVAADKGVAAAMTNLGAMAERGAGVRKDAAAARAWYEAAAKAGCGVGAANLGAMLHRGKGPAGVERGTELTSARRLYENAAALGDGGAMNNLGVMCSRGEGGARDAVAARRWLRKAAEVPSGVFVSSARYAAAHFEEAGAERALDDVPQRAAPREALFNLGLLAERGAGGQRAVPREAARWFALAAEKGLRDAANVYGAVL